MISGIYCNFSHLAYAGWLFYITDSCFIYCIDLYLYKMIANNAFYTDGKKFTVKVPKGKKKAYKKLLKKAKSSKYVIK